MNRIGFNLFCFLLVIRSFDVNKPGCEVDDLKGGVAGANRAGIYKEQATVPAVWTFPKYLPHGPILDA